MANEETIINKQISINTIIELARYLETQKEEYIRLMNIDETRNRNVPLNEQVYQYKSFSSARPEIQYEITFKDNKSIQQTDYSWFIQNLVNPSKIKMIGMHSHISYKDNSMDKNNIIYKKLNESIYFYEDRVYLRVDGLETKNEVFKQHSYIKGLLENEEDRFNKTVKRRNIRIQSFCLAIGFVLTYILFPILNGMKSNLPEIFVKVLSNKYAIIIGQWLVAAILGNLLGYGIMMSLYKNILPKRRYSYYSRFSHKSVYEDNIDSYIGKCEVQIGMYANNGKNRLLIEKIYKITRIIVLAQVVISGILFFLLK